MGRRIPSLMVVIIQLRDSWVFHLILVLLLLLKKLLNLKNNSLWCLYLHPPPLTLQLLCSPTMACLCTITMQCLSTSTTVLNSSHTIEGHSTPLWECLRLHMLVLFMAIVMSSSQ